MKKKPAQVIPLNAAHIYQIKVTLKRSKPSIWRRIQVRGYTSLGELHDLIQIAMGWEDEHMHIFIIDGTTFGDPDTADAERDEFEVLLDEVAEEGDTLSYEYDFGDGWVHELEIEKVLDPEPGAKLPALPRRQARLPSRGLWWCSRLRTHAQNSHQPQG